MLDIKLWLEEDGDFNRNDPLYSFKFVQFKNLKIDTKCYHLLATMLYPTYNVANLKIFAYL